MISDEFWEREFARSPAALGQSIKLNDVPVTIVGVNPKGFTGAASTLPSQTPAVIVALAKATLVTPVVRRPELAGEPGVAVRQHPGAHETGRERQRGAGGARHPVLRHRPCDAPDPRRRRRAEADAARRQPRPFRAATESSPRPISVLMIFLGLVLLLACANIATLMLARGARRQREMSVRLALGAGRARILRQMLIESLLLAANRRRLRIGARLRRTRRHRAVHPALRLAGPRFYRADLDRHGRAVRPRARTRGDARTDRRRRQGQCRRSGSPSSDFRSRWPRS